MPLEAGVVTGVDSGLGVTTGMGVCAVSAPVLGSCFTPEEPPISAGASVCPGAAVCPGVTCSHHVLLQTMGPIAGLIACSGCGPLLSTLCGGSHPLPGVCWLTRMQCVSCRGCLSRRNWPSGDRLVSLPCVDPVHPAGLQSRIQMLHKASLSIMACLPCSIRDVCAAALFRSAA